MQLAHILLDSEAVTVGWLRFGGSAKSPQKSGSMRCDEAGFILIATKQITRRNILHKTLASITAPRGAHTDEQAVQSRCPPTKKPFVEWVQTQPLVSPQCDRSKLPQLLEKRQGRCSSLSPWVT